MGLSDDLAARLAYESLTSLSGMASKVQETIDHNRAAFANQVALLDRQIMQKAIFAWKLRHSDKVSKRERARRAASRILRGTLSRAFFYWKDQYKLKDKTRLMRIKVGPSSIFTCECAVRACYCTWHVCLYYWGPYILQQHRS